MSLNLLKVGDKAPNFSLLDSNEKIYTLSSFKNQNLIIWFFPKASTPGWIVEGVGFRDEFKNFQKNNYDIIGVSADAIQKQKKFVDKYKFPFPMLCDEEHVMLKAYKVWGLKKFMGREYMGINRITYIINKKGNIQKVFDNVKTRTHAQDILCTI